MLDQHPDTGTFISELMQSCGGQVIPPKELYPAVYRLLKERGVVCIGDEVQTGFGRLGEAFWAFDYYGVTPDIVTCGKAMGNGFPVAAVICTKAVAESFKARDMEFFSTFGGNPMAVTAGIDIVKSRETREEDGGTAKKIIMRMRAKGVLVSRDGVKGNVLKIKPPIVFNKENVDTLLYNLKETLNELGF
ncbi:unnamed protein product [Sphagnum balticum]